MTEELALEYVRTLYKIYNDKALEVPQVRKNYTQIMVNYEDGIVMEAIDNIIKGNKFCPKPAELYEELQKLSKIQKDNNRLLNSQEYCYVCENTGIVTLRTTEYDKVLYCTECEKGKEQAYDGRTCKQKSDYYIEPVTKYYNIDELKSRNMFDKKNPGQPVPMPETVRQMLRKMGMNHKTLVKGA